MHEYLPNPTNHISLESQTSNSYFSNPLTFSTRYCISLSTQIPFPHSQFLNPKSHISNLNQTPQSFSNTPRTPDTHKISIPNTQMAIFMYYLVKEEEGDETGGMTNGPWPWLMALLASQIIDH